MKMTQKGFFRVCFQPITTLNCCTTCISWEIGSYNTQQSAIMNIRTFFAYLSQNPQHDFPKMRGGGVKGRLELFRSFIRSSVPYLRSPLEKHAGAGRSPFPTGTSTQTPVKPWKGISCFVFLGLNRIVSLHIHIRLYHFPPLHEYGSHWS